MIAFLASLDGQKPDEPTFRTKVDLLSVAVRVTDRKDNEIHGLTADRFSLYEDGTLQKISLFAAEEEPVSLGILLDVSSSMTATGKLDHAKEALSRLIGTMRPEDEMFYLRFHRKVEKTVDFTSDPDRIRSAIAKTGATQDGTSLYDAVARALCYMRSARRHRRVLLVVTDGADQHSHRSLEELIPLVQASQAQAFIVGYFGKDEYELYKNSGNHKVTLVTSQEIDNPVTVFKRLANESGAESFFPSSPAKLQEAVDAVAHQLRTQYTLAYYPKSNERDFRRIEVKVAQAGARVRTRRGFGRVEQAVDSLDRPCEQGELKPYPYESKVAVKNGCTVYHEDFQNQASGWPSKDRYHYAAGAYEIVSKKHVGPEHTFPISPGNFSGGAMGSADPVEGVLVANGPSFGDLNASIGVELKSTEGAGLVFRLNDLGYYAVIISKGAAGSRKIAFKLVKKYHLEATARDLSPWTEFSFSDLIANPQKNISVQCRGPVITILLEGQSIAKFEDRDFDEGMVGMVLYGTGRAVFRDLMAEEVCDRRLLR
jgi:Ca-activated chloride channel family protein